MSKQQDELLAATNQQRAGNRIALVGIHPALQEAAQKHAEWMALNRRMSHAGEGGNTFVDRIRAAGYPNSNAAENIAWGYTDAASCVQGWMNSAGHRNNMLNPQYQSTGFGAARASNGQWYWCGLYGVATGSTQPPITPPAPKPHPKWLEWLLRLVAR